MLFNVFFFVQTVSIMFVSFFQSFREPTDLPSYFQPKVALSRRKGAAVVLMIIERNGALYLDYFTVVKLKW